MEVKTKILSGCKNTKLYQSLGGIVTLNNNPQVQFVCS